MAVEPTNAEQGGEQLWESGWEGHELEQLRRLSRLSLHEKLLWLSDAHEMVLALQQGRQKLFAAGGQPPHKIEPLK